jgi:hypothetical protein
VPKGKVSLALLVSEKEERTWQARRLRMGISASLSHLATEAVQDLLSSPNPAAELREQLDHRDVGGQSSRRQRGQLVHVALPSATYHRLRSHAKACHVSVAAAVLAVMAQPPMPTSEIEQLRQELNAYRARFGTLTAEVLA